MRITHKNSYPKRERTGRSMEREGEGYGRGKDAGEGAGKRGREIGGRERAMASVEQP